MNAGKKGSINRMEDNMRILMYYADVNKKGVLDVSMSSKRERRLAHKLAECHQIAEGVAGTNTTEIIDSFCKHYISNFEYIGRIDERIGYVASVVPDKNEMH